MTYLTAVNIVTACLSFVTLYYGVRIMRSLGAKSPLAWLIVLSASPIFSSVCYFIDKMDNELNVYIWITATFRFAHYIALFLFFRYLSRETERCLRKICGELNGQKGTNAGLH